MTARIAQALAPTAEPRPVPAARFQVSTLEGFKARPDADALDQIEATFTEEGFANVEAVPTSGDDRGWAVAVFATASPYPK